MKICLLNDSFPPVIDGVANVVLNYARILTEEFGDEVAVATPKYPDTDYSEYPYQVVPYQSLDTTSFTAGYRAGNPLSLNGLKQLVDFHPDILHVHSPGSAIVMGRILQKQMKVPMVYTYHSKYDVDITKAVGEGFLKNETIKALVTNIDAADDVWVVSEGAGENLTSLGYEDSYRIAFNGVDFPKGKADDALVKEVTKDYDLPEGVPMFLFVGRMVSYKGIPLILEAMRTLTQKGLDYRMVFVGKGQERKDFEKKVQEYGIALESTAEDGTITRISGKAAASGKKSFTKSKKSESAETAGCNKNPESSGKVIFVGPIYDREKLRAWNTRADLFLFPSLYDTNGIVVREAAACGLASVLIQGSCAAEGIVHGQNGFLMEENAESLSSLLEELFPNFDSVHKTGQNALDQIYISWEDSVRDARVRYEELIKMSQAGSLPQKSNDFFYDSFAKLITGTKYVFARRNEFYAGMQDNIADFKENLSEFKEGMGGFKSGFKTGIQNLQEYRKKHMPTQK